MRRVCGVLEALHLLPLRLQLRCARGWRLVPRGLEPVAWWQCWVVCRTATRPNRPCSVHAGVMLCWSWDWVGAEQLLAAREERNTDWRETGKRNRLLRPLVVVGVPLLLLLVVVVSWWWSSDLACVNAPWSVCCLRWLHHMCCCHVT